MDLLEWLTGHIKDLVDSGFYGKLVLQFEAGNLTVLRKEETLKPPPGKLGGKR